MQGLDVWLCHHPAPILEDYLRAYHWLVCEQSTLGWRQLFNGRWSGQWTTLHFDPVPEPLSDQKWTIRMIDLHWKSVHMLWDLWNGRVHGVDATTRAKIQKEKAHHELLTVYTL